MNSPAAAAPSGTGRGDPLSHLPEESRKLLVRAGELRNLHRHLQQVTQKHREQFVQLAALNQQLAQKSQHFKRDQEAYAREKAEWAQLTERWTKEREAWSQQLAAYAAGREALARQNAEVAKERERLTQLQAATSKQMAEIVRQRQEIDKLKQDVARERESHGSRETSLTQQREACVRLQADLAKEWEGLLRKQAEIARAQHESTRQRAELANAQTAQVQRVPQPRPAHMPPEDDEVDFLGVVRARAGAPAARAAEQNEERGSLQALLAERDAELETLKTAQLREKKNSENQRQTLRDEVQSLRQQLDEEIAVIEQLQHEKSQLEQMLHEQAPIDFLGGAPAAAAPAIAANQNELGSLLAERDAELEALKTAHAREKKNSENQRQTLRDEVQSLRQQLDEEIAVIEQLQRGKSRGPQPAPADFSGAPSSSAIPVALVADGNEALESLHALLAERDADLQGLKAAQADFDNERAALRTEIQSLRQQLEEETALIEQIQRERHEPRLDDVGFLGGLPDVPPEAEQPEELESVRALLAERDRMLEELKTAQAKEKKNFDNQRQTLRDEVQSLRQQLDEELALIERLQRGKPQSGPDFAAYQADVDDLHQQLEVDRRALESELQLRHTWEEDFIPREPIELARQRALISLERPKLDSLRDEVRQEIKRLS